MSAPASPAADPMRRRARPAYHDHLVDLVALVEAQAARLRTADPGARAAAAARARVEVARATLRLDASPLADDTAAAVEQGAPTALAAVPADAGEPAHGWAAALRLEGLPTQDVAAVEYANCLAAVDDEPDLAARLFAEPLATLTALHARLCVGLVDPVRGDRARTTDQAVHDGAQGQLLFALPDPDTAWQRLQDLCAWLGGAAAPVPTPVVAAVVHEALLEWQPFEGAGGRLARAAARLVLRARGLDPDGALVLDRRPAADPIGYHRQVAATIRRRGDATLWVEWWLEGVALTATATADRVHGVEPVVPARLAAWLDATATAQVTVADYAAAVGATPDEARRELIQGQRAGVVRAEPATRGLRYARGAAPELA